MVEAVPDLFVPDPGALARIMCPAIGCYCVVSRNAVQPHESTHGRHLGIQRGTFAL